MTAAPVAPAESGSTELARSTAVALDHQREAASRALAEQPGFDIATIPDIEFERGLERIKLRQVRMQRILDKALVDGAHYGNPVDRNNKKAFPRPILYRAGAAELASLFRLRVFQVSEPTEDARTDFFGVTVHLAIADSRGHVLREIHANCNTREARFRAGVDESGKPRWVYKDPQEERHECWMMAEKRAFVALVIDATGAGAFFVSEEAMRQSTTPGAPAAPMPWTKEEKEFIYSVAKEAGITTGGEFGEFSTRVLGRAEIYTDDVATLEAALRERIEIRKKQAAEREHQRMHGAGARKSSPEQIGLYRSLLKSHVFSDAERAAAEELIATEPGFEVIGQRIDEATDAIKARKAAEAAAKRKPAEPPAEMWEGDDAPTREPGEDNE